MNIVDLIDYGLIGVAILLLFRLMRRTEALRITIGIVIIFVISFLASLAGLSKTAAILQTSTEMLIVGLVVIFHPELRMTLKKLGGITKMRFREEVEVITEIETCVFGLSKRRIGALIVLDHDKTLAYQSENMTSVDALCTSDLLETIFYPLTALHDGAVLIHHDRIAYAGCKLPLSGRKREGFGHLGTRHLVAIENAEAYGVTVIVVSEETGTISVATSDGFTRISEPEQFRAFFREKSLKHHTF
ncbi:DNA integrity scanning protein DisA nucleotide-binding domain protein (plasmid) [Pontibacillus sp. ALD_SL1]|uniref:diadenylate cyclase n=1 Tax=Pontibacillus sp. ALD_SL1 TaxID=2777185 RepID=UPI001A962FCA|nr:diadenylate cyclase [Pontibacillus sp. ALD_SL1]QST03067.1 DNA integrity scanning protein DisA nucleotide-binding domain protein [Pontibacillus sp. ALD_SL1]